MGCLMEPNFDVPFKALTHALQDIAVKEASMQEVMSYLHELEPREQFIRREMQKQTHIRYLESATKMC